ncbi:MAG: hypothetical protein JNL26_10485 [Gemmatimonadetes bacterium]|nr:hypothetical protein [Gemmatimonadota bacterium]
MGAFPRRWLVAVLVIGACERPAVERANDTTPSTVPPPPPPPEVTVATDTPWDTAAGPAFLVMGATPDQAALIVPFVDTATSVDTLKVALTPWRGVAFDFFRQGIPVGTASAGDSIALDAPDDCSAWPALRVARGDTTGWNIAFPTGRFTALGVDSLAGLTPRDSAGLTRELARVASGAPGDTADAMRGLPYVVHRAWRTTLPSGRSWVLAEIDRTLNQEANPVHEHLLLVAERDSSAGSRWELAWSERMVGGEEASESIDLIVIGTPRGRPEPVILFARYLGDGVIYAMLQRESTGRWRLRWTSPYVGC